MPNIRFAAFIIWTAMISSFLDRPIDANMVIFGEIGLAGEVRGVNRPELRIKEAKKLGFTRCLLSKSNMEISEPIDGMEIVGIETLKDLMEHVF